jgi:DNA-binding ferritin-like protein (Dps family)/DNA-directed RNA polymerase subunit RPC12/RpoP
MNYLDSMEYRDWKKQLSGEYKEKFDIIEKYYLNANNKESYEVQMTLSQILGDFLLAQKEEKPLERVIGKDIRRYAIQMLQAEYETQKKGVYYWFNLSVIAIWLILFLIFTKTFLFHGYDELSFIEKTEQIYVGLFELIVIGVYSFGELVRTKLAAVMFFRPKLIYFTRIIVLFTCSLIMALYNDVYVAADRIFSIRIPALLYAILAVPSTIYIIIVCVISIKKTHAKKKELSGERNVILPEQVICPSCGKEHDYDYPKCPHCGYKVQKEVLVLKEKAK